MAKEMARKFNQIRWQGDPNAHISEMMHLQCQCCMLAGLDQSLISWQCYNLDCSYHSEFHLQISKEMWTQCVNISVTALNLLSS